MLLGPRSATLEKMPDFEEKIAKTLRKDKESMKKSNTKSVKR